MPRGAKPGERRGGRAVGTKNRGEIEKAIRAERVIANAKANGRKLSVEHMQDFIGVLAGMAGYYQPTFPGMAHQNPNGNDKEFERWFRHFLDLAKSLAPFESATMRSIMVAPAPAMNDPDRKKQFTLTIFENGKPPMQIAPPMKKSEAG